MNHECSRRKCQCKSPPPQSTTQSPTTCSAVKHDARVNSKIQYLKNKSTTSYRHTNRSSDVTFHNAIYNATTKKNKRTTERNKKTLAIDPPYTTHTPTHHHTLHSPSCFYGPNWRETTRGGWSKSPRACHPPRRCRPNEIFGRRWSNQCIFQTRSTNNVAPLLCQRPRTCELNPMLMGRREREKGEQKGKEGALDYTWRQVPTPCDVPVNVFTT